MRGGGYGDANVAVVDAATELDPRKRASGALTPSKDRQTTGKGTDPLYCQLTTPA